MKKQIILFTFLAVISILVFGCVKKPVVKNQNANANIFIGDQMETSIWKMSNNMLLLEIPTQWSIQQRDGGGISSIFISNTDQAENFLLNITIINSRLSANNEKWIFSEWVNNDMATNEKIVQAVNFGRTAISGNESLTFTNPKDNKALYYIDVGDKFVKIEHDVEVMELRSIQKIINSIKFYPTAQEFRDAKTIP